jgi:rhamnosyltransferase
VLLDDDTVVTAQYFSALLQQAAAVEADVYLPVVHDGKGILSPCRIKGHRVGRLASLEGWSQDMTAINTGMALRLPVIQGLRYDEKYFLDYVDHAFVRRLKAAGARFCVLDTALRQEFSNNLRGNREGAMIRFRLFIKDFLLFCSDSASGRAYGRLYVIKRGLVLAARYHSAAFLLEAIKLRH